MNKIIAVPYSTEAEITAYHKMVKNKAALNQFLDQNGVIGWPQVGNDKDNNGKAVKVFYCKVRAEAA